MKQPTRHEKFTTLAHPLYEFNAAVQRLQEEHVMLDEALTEVYGMAKSVGLTGDAVDWALVLRHLRDKVAAFRRDLEAHAKWEEETMFPMAAWYFGDDPDVLEQFTQMDQEHAIAEQFIDAYMAGTERITGSVHWQEAKELASYLLQAHKVLTRHFRQEEDMIDALADRSNQFGF